tara:strand:+ start:50 stop:751 length:702 start_codon:yes stop_codon:yes gene_type:complete
MNHYVYKITRKSTGRFYIGIRMCKCAPLDDAGYWGSGTRVRAIVAKHGTDELEKQILVQVHSRKEAMQIEAALVGPGQVNDPACLNLVGGGWNGPFSEETRAKIVAANTGRKHTPEARANMSAAQKGKKPTPETRAKISAAGKGRKYTPETRAKMSAAQKGRKLSPEHHAKLLAANKGKKRTPETRAKISASSKGRNLTPETRAKISASQKARCARVRAAKAKAASRPSAESA